MQPAVNDVQDAVWRNAPAATTFSRQSTPNAARHETLPTMIDESQLARSLPSKKIGRCLPSSAAPRETLAREGRPHARGVWRAIFVLLILSAGGAVHPAAQTATQPASPRFRDQPLTLSAARCAAATLGTSIPASAIGEPVSSVTLSEPRWVPADASLPARCEVDGRMAPIDPKAPAINFRVWLPAEWNRRAVQQGGAGINGVIPDLRGAPVRHRRALAGAVGFRDLRQ